MNHFIIFMTIPAASILHRFPELLNHSLHLKGVSWELITMRMHPFYKLPWLSSVDGVPTALPTCSWGLVLFVVTVLRSRETPGFAHRIYSKSPWSPTPLPAFFNVLSGS